MLPTVGKVKQGARVVTHDGAAWAPLACTLHAGQAATALEERVDPATGQPRVVARRDPDTGEQVEQVAQFPVYSADVGHDPACPACQEAVLAARLHMLAVAADREQADHEFQRELRRRGMTG